MVMHGFQVIAELKKQKRSPLSFTFFFPCAKACLHPQYQQINLCTGLWLKDLDKIFHARLYIWSPKAPALLLCASCHPGTRSWERADVNFLFYRFNNATYTSPETSGMSSANPCRKSQPPRCLKQISDRSRSSELPSSAYLHTNGGLAA